MKTIRGVEFIIDADDYELVSKYRWTVGKSNLKSRKEYLCIRTSANFGEKKRAISLPKLIMGIESGGMVVDHVNGDTFDNRKQNLRVCSPADNRKNLPIYTNNTSGYKGVCIHGNKYRARIRVDKKTINGGVYSSAREAAQRYNELAITYHGDFARLNIIQ